MDAVVIACQRLAVLFTECSFVCILAYAALLYLFTGVFRKTLYIPFKLYFLAKYLPGVDLQKLGRWAVITGATDGIGKEYAKSLAQKGLDIVLVSRSPSKLAKVAEEIKTGYGVCVQTIVADFTRVDIYDKIKKALEGLDIAVLINNVGMTTNLSTFLKTKQLLEKTVDLVNVNCVSMTNMTALVLPHMLEKRKGVIVNLSSIASYGFIGTATYSATKAYASKISEMVQRTYKDSGVIIQTIEPGMVETPMVMVAYKEDSPRIDFMDKALKYSAISADTFVKSAINTIGWSDCCNGHVLHHFVCLFSRMQGAAADVKLLGDLPE
ncbi:very-long-chain 3-oxoacyl-CoA reductase-like [Watersipora subatra]|uniref:very-long-chain 3-oxoacyl-CoA reductase-like n=1 Tax=Watersipora subatra TaxID=2589382 RepID=UPI00355C8FBC